MKFTETNLKGAFVIEIEKRKDARGYFARSWCENELKTQGLNPLVRQMNVSQNLRRGTLRGMHFQIPPYEEVKTVRCSRGAVYDVIIDLRKGSPTFRRWYGIELTGDNGKMLYVPEGFAHGYLTLRDDSEVSYTVSEFYHPASERGVRYNDPVFRIRWPVAVQTVSEKDGSWPDFVAGESEVQRTGDVTWS